MSNYLFQLNGDDELQPQKVEEFMTGLHSVEQAAELAKPQPINYSSAKQYEVALAEWEDAWQYKLDIAEALDKDLVQIGLYQEAAVAFVGNARPLAKEKKKVNWVKTLVASYLLIGVATAIGCAVQEYQHQQAINQDAQETAGVEYRPLFPLERPDIQ